MQHAYCIEVTRTVYAAEILLGYAAEMAKLVVYGEEMLSVYNEPKTYTGTVHVAMPLAYFVVKVYSVLRHLFARKFVAQGCLWDSDAIC